MNDTPTAGTDRGLCRCCGGSGLSWSEICIHCGGSGSDSEKDHVDCPSRIRREVASGLFRTALALGRIASMMHRCRSYLLGWGKEARQGE
jgi:predicted amidophosphoribosyltransferase